MSLSLLVPGDHVRIRDERWIVTRRTSRAEAAVLDVRGSDRTNLGTRASFLLPFELVERLPSSTAVRRVRLPRWRRIVRPVIAGATPSWNSLRLPLHARISLLPFQLEPALAVTRGLTSRILLADEVGLGKTIQAALIVAEILERTSHGRALIVAPASLREQWRDELRDRFDLTAWIADSTSLARLGAAALPGGNPWSAHAITLTSIDFIKRPEVMRALEALVWDAIVFDEAHALSGRSDRATAAGALAQRARTVVMLTATPHSGDDRAFQDLCGIGDIGRQFPLLTFRRTRRDVGLTLTRRTFTLRVRPSLAEREMHRALTAYTERVRVQRGSDAGPAHLAMAVLIRRACSSAASLARSVERRLTMLAGEPPGMKQILLPIFDAADDEEPGVELGTPGLDDPDEERRRLEGILRLAGRASATESKLRALARLLRRTAEPAIVFTEYRDTLARLADKLRAYDPVLLHGGLTAAERRDTLRRFTSGSARLLLATDAASEGLNLQQRCRLVLNLELPWTPLRLEQRIGRVERIGQQRCVHAIHLLASGTAEESLRLRLQARSDRATAALDDLRHDAPESKATSDIRLQLNAAAELEAARITDSRRLARDGTDATADGRPPVALLRRRRARRSAVWGVRLVFVAADQRLVWETLLGAECRHPVAGNGLWRQIASAPELLTTALDAEAHRALALLEAALKIPLDLGARREHAIAAALGQERARLSAHLLQPGLFDRRSERAVAAQGAVIDEALQRCHVRAAELAGLRRIAVERRSLAFAVVRR